MSESETAGVPGLVAHFERFLGPVRSGWMAAPTGERMPFQVVRWSRGSDVGSMTYSSLGMSRHRLQGRGGDAVRQEFVLLTTPSLPVEYVLSVLNDAGRAALDVGRGLRQGDVLGPVPPPVPGSSMAALYVALPVYFPDEFAVHRPRDGAEVEVLWLVPVSQRESDFVEAYGWEAFEELLATQDPDLVDVYRPEISC